MKEPERPPGPDFEKARQVDDFQRQQRVAQLSPEHHQDYVKMHRQHGRELKELGYQQRRERPGLIAERMRGHLFEKAEPHLRPHGLGGKSREDLNHALDDFVAGRESRATRQYAHTLYDARAKAERDVQRDQTHERHKVRDEQRRERDEFLERAGKERKQEQKHGLERQFRRSARETAAPEFEKAARDPSWQRAFNRAAQKEAAHTREREHDLDKTR